MSNEANRRMLTALGLDPNLTREEFLAVVETMSPQQRLMHFLNISAQEHALECKAKRQVMGRPRSTFGDPQVAESLELIGQGHGRISACALVGVSYKTFARKFREDPEFAFQVRRAEAERIEGCEATLFQVATGRYDTPHRIRAAIAYLGRRDKLKAARIARKEKAAQARQKRGAGSDPASSS